MMLQSWVELLEQHTTATVFSFIGLIVVIVVTGDKIAEIFKAIRGK